MPNETTFAVITLAILCAGIIYWTYRDVKKEKVDTKGEEYDQAYMKKMRAWRVYGIAAIGLIISVWELLPRLFYFTYVNYIVCQPK